jgi:hypothetical protein
MQNVEYYYSYRIVKIPIFYHLVLLELKENELEFPYQKFYSYGGD